MRLLVKTTGRLALAILAVLLPSCQPEGPSASAATEDDNLVPRDADQALEWLLAGNERFVTGTPRHDHESIRRRMALSKGQNPFAIILGCADSRVSPELLFDHGLGNLFVIRVAGNIVSEDEAGSIEYAIVHLGTRLVVVLGHETCGAVTAALGSIDKEPRELMTLIQRIQPALGDIDRSLPMKEQVHLGVEANVRQSVAALRAIAERENLPAEERTRIVGAVYELETGRVRILD
jgi:carbonic anhydrase